MIVVTYYYNTDERGAWVPDETPWEDTPRTVHGPFGSVAEAEAWANGRPDDIDVRECVIGDAEVDAATVNAP